MANGRMDPALKALLNRLEPKMRREVERALAKLQKRVTLAKLVDIIEKGDELGLRRVLSPLRSDVEATLEMLTRAFTAGAKAASAISPVLEGAFALTNQLATKAAEQQSAQLVTAISQETRKAIQSVIGQAFREGTSPAETARNLRPVIGLTERQSLAVQRLRTTLTKQGVSADVVSARMSRYAATLLRQRATLIARTELIDASTQGQLALWKQAIADGLIASNARKKWIVTPDDRLCPICQALAGKTIPIAGLFPGGVIGPPRHPNCRCTLALSAGSVSRRRAA